MSDEHLNRLASRYLLETGRECLQAAAGVMVVVGAIGAFFTDFGDPVSVSVLATVAAALGVLLALGLWTDGPSRRLRQVRWSTSRAGRFIRAHLADRTVRAKREIDGHKVYLTRELKDELKSRWWWQSDSRIDAVLDTAAESAALSSVPGLRWCATKTFPLPGETADPDAHVLYIRWSLPGFGRVIVLGHAAPQPGPGEADEGFEDGYIPGRWLNRERVAAGTAIAAAGLLLVLFVVVVLPLLLFAVGALVALVLLPGFLSGDFKRKR